MAKKNGKAKRKARKLKTFEVGILPIKHRNLTPERAAKWLEEEYPGYSDLVHTALEYARDGEDRSAFGWLGYCVRTMVEACTEAIRTGQAVNLDSALTLRKGEEPRFLKLKELTDLLSLPVAEDAIEELQGTSARAFNALVLAARRYIAEGARGEQVGVESKLGEPMTAAAALWMSAEA